MSSTVIPSSPFALTDTLIIDLASNEELVNELFKRAKIFGVLVSIDVEVKGDPPKLGTPVSGRKTGQLSQLGAAMMLNQAAGKILDELAK